jgi:hypothetical protein
MNHHTIIVRFRRGRAPRVLVRHKLLLPSRPGKPFFSIIEMFCERQNVLYVGWYITLRSITFFFSHLTLVIFWVVSSFRVLQIRFYLSLHAGNMPRPCHSPWFDAVRFFILNTSCKKHLILWKIIVQLHCRWWKLVTRRLVRCNLRFYQQIK